MADHPWELLKNAWPFDEELREVPVWNTRFGLGEGDGFDARLRPVFLVGDLDAATTDYLFIGMKPGLGSETNPAFRAERAALTTTSFETYRESRRNYFLSPALNRTHYWPVAKIIAALEGDARPTDLGGYLARHVVQIEMVPFFMKSAVLSDDQLVEMSRESAGGQMAQRVFANALALKPWKAIIVRYAQTLRAFGTVYNDKVASSSYGRLDLATASRRVQILLLPGRNVSDADIARIAGRIPAVAAKAGIQSPAPRRGPVTFASTDLFEELREFIMSLGADVSPRPRRANGSFVFKRRRNFVTLIPQKRGLKIDVFRGQDWQDGVPVQPGIGLGAARKLIADAYELAG